MNAVKVRLSGDLPAITEALRALFRARDADGFEIPETSGLYPNRREPGYRVYVTLRFPTDDTTDLRGAAHYRQAIRRPAAPLPAKETHGKRHLP